MTLLEIHAKEKYSLPDLWQPVMWKCMPPSASEVLYYELVGAVYPACKSGERKGKPNYRKPESGTARTAYISTQEHREWLTQWEQRTGLCHECQGKTTVFSGWSATEGTRTRECFRCKGTGKAPSK